jgi:UDP-glucose:(heptosyl)LPS alpha-1,3-glucosyltransferase
MDVFRPGGGVHKAWLKQEMKSVRGALPKFFTRLRQVVSLDHKLVLYLEGLEYGPSQQHEIIAISKMVKDEIIHYYGCPPDRITVIYCGVDLDRFTPANRAAHRAAVRRELGLSDDEVMILFLGHNYKRKGLGALIRALPPLQKQRARFRVVVAGRGRRGPMDALAARLGVADRIQYVGQVPASERFYAAADIYTLPSYYDPFANSMVEALASGLPVVTSIYTGAGELVENGRQGYVVDPDDSSAFSAALSALLPRDTRESAGRAARLRAEEYPMERNYRETLAVYGKALKRKTAGRA